MAITYVETYLGCDIYYVTPPDVSQAIYRSPCVTGDYFKISAVWKRICTGQGGTWDGTSCTLPEPPPEPPPPTAPSTLLWLLLAAGVGVAGIGLVYFLTRK